ncbi:MAG: hypothetical protein MJ236_04470, partial [Clostridia bacterium]|nr:hypothetical protein [Clostridia bacterium]
IADPVLLSNDNGTNTPDMKWVKTKSVKEIVENDITTNVTTTVYRTVAVIKRAEGVGYVNYYIDDFDNHTGSYCYSSNNGNDFEWLNAYVGKIVELYVSPINAKSAASGCNYRFVPISIIDPDYKLDPKTIPSIVYDCFVSGSIAGSYDSVGSIEVPTTVDAELLGVKATVSYASSDESVIAISNGVLSIKKSGSAKVSITVTIDGSSTKYEKDVTVAIKDEVASITVKEAIDTADDVEIIVKGIVASGISNQVGFYLIDETGAIAVKCSADELAKVKIGELVVVKGTKTHFKKADGYAGQSCILDSTIENNLHGNHEYSTNAFLGNMTVEDMVARDVAIDYSTEIHVVTATLKKSDKAWTVISDDGSAYITLYAGSVDQYSWLGAYDGQKVTMDFALCNWNAKKPYKACVLAVYTDSGKIVNPGKLG